MPWRKKLRWMARMALFAFILGAAAFLSAVTAIRLAIQGRETSMPNLVGIRAGDAQSELARAGLSLRIVDHVYSDQPTDYIVRQSPEAGTRVKVPQRAHVVISLGPRLLSIPLLEGKSLRAARIELLRSGLQLGVLSGAHLPGWPAEHVVRQHPPPGEMTAGSPRVNVLVARGEPEPAYVMPALTGLSLAEAQRRLWAMAVRPAVRFVPAAGPEAWARGAVVAHSPPPGARVVPGAPVELQVAEFLPPPAVLESPPGK